jgi:hypothetical protein
VSQKRIINARRDARPPWQPLSVSLTALLFPAGAAVLTVRNLERLGHIDSATARQLSLAVIGISAVGLTLLLYFASRGTSGSPHIDSGVAYVLTIGIGAASYAAQRLPFRTWRTGHARSPLGHWLSALGMSGMYELVTILAAIPCLVGMILLSSVGLPGPLP